MYKVYSDQSTLRLSTFHLIIIGIFYDLMLMTLRDRMETNSCSPLEQHKEGHLKKLGVNNLMLVSHGRTMNPLTVLNRRESLDQQNKEGSKSM